MAEIEGSDGNNYNIPDFAMEDTQVKILAALKQAFNLGNKELENAKQALNAENKNGRAQAEALTKLGDDIRESAKGGGGILGGLSMGINIAGGAIGSLTKGFAGLTATVATVGAGMAALALNITKGFGDDLKNAGLAESGAAFGELGKELNVVIPGLMTMGYSVEDAAGAINDFRGAMTATSGKAIQGVIVEFNKLTNGGARYGRTLTENLDYLAEEIDYRTRLGFIDRQNAAQAAKDAQEMMDNQINASKLLGKSVDEIANGVKDLFTGDLDIAAQLANLGPEAEQALRKAFNTLEGAGLPKDIQSGMLKYMTDPIAMASEEARSVINDLNILPNNMGQPVIDAMENVRDALDNGTPEEIEAAQRALAEATLALGPQIKDLSDEEKERLTVLGKSRQSLQGFLASQNTLAIAAKNYANINHDQVEALNESLQNSVMFDNQITALMNTFDVLKQTLKAGFAPALANITGILGDIANPESPLGSFQIRLKGISESFIESLNSLLGTTGSQEEATAAAKGMLERFAGYIESAANGVLGLVQAFQNTEGDNFFDRIVTFFMENVLKPLGSAIVDGLSAMWDNIDLMDIITGNTDNAAIQKGNERMDKLIARADADLEKNRISKAEYDQQVAGAKSQGAEQILIRSRDKEYDTEQTLGLLKKAGLQISDLDGTQLAELFPNAEALEEAIVKAGGSQAEFTVSAAKLSEKFAKLSESERTFLGNKETEESEALAEISKGFLEATQKVIETPPKIEVPDAQPAADDVKDVVPDTQPAADDVKDVVPDTQPSVNEVQELVPDAQPSVDNVQEIVPDTQPSVDNVQEVVITATKIDEKPGARPVTPTSTSVQTDPEGAEPTSASPTSQDGTNTQEVKPAVTSEDSQENKNKSMEDLLLTQLNILTDIKNNTKKTASGISSLPSVLG